MCTHVPDASVPIRFRERSDLADKRAAGKPAAFLFCAHRAGATSIQIGICPQGGRPSRDERVCFRSLPDPLGIVLCRYKLEFEEGSAGPEQHCHSEPVRTLAWESPSFKVEPINFGPEKLGDCHTRKADWFAMTGFSTGSTPTEKLFRGRCVIFCGSLPERCFSSSRGHFREPLLPVLSAARAGSDTWVRCR